MLAVKLEIESARVAADIADDDGCLGREDDVRDAPAGLFLFPFDFVEIAASDRLKQPAATVDEPDSGAGIGKRDIDFFEQYVQHVVEVEGGRDRLVDLAQRLQAP